MLVRCQTDVKWMLNRCRVDDGCADSPLPGRAPPLGP